MNKTVYIINCKASRVEKSLDTLNKKLLEQSENYKEDTIYVDNPNELEKNINIVADKKPEIIVIVGGDGTITTSINYLLKNGFDGCVGIIPLGTSNNLARNLGIPLSLNGAFDRVRKNNPKRIYMGEANGDVFTLFTNIGITASVSKKVEFRLKKKIGQLAYIFEAIKQFKLHEGFYYTVRFDNSEAQLSGASHQIMIINSKINEHLPIVIAPESKVTKPKLTLHIYRTQSNKFKIIYSVLLYIVSFGRINRWTITKEVSNLHITTKPQVPYSLDGEVHQEKELIIKAAAKSIKILC